jgi:hypothetical protein
MSVDIVAKIFEERKQQAERAFGLRIYDDPPLKIKPCLFHQMAKQVGSYKYCGKCGRVEIYIGPENGWHTVGWVDVSPSKQKTEEAKQ